MSISINHNYEAAIGFINSLIDYEKLRPDSYSEQEYDIEGFRQLLNLFENPQNSFPSIHIAGTKGKGSTSYFIETFMRKAGLRTGLYTSPHIYDYTERIKVCGDEISKTYFAEYIFSAAKKNKDIRTQNRNFFRTVFELLTAVGFLYFKDCQIDIGIIETGLGGRLDCTNVVTPEVSVITSIGLDHTAILGDTLSRIAYEKSGIIKKDKPVIIAHQTPEAANEAIPVIKKIAEEINSEIIYADKYFPVVSITPQNDLQKIEYISSGGEKFFILTNAIGEHQAYNIQTALTVFSVLAKNDTRLNLDKIKNITVEVNLSGRCEIIYDEFPIVIDGAHCPLSVEALCKTLKQYFPQKNPIFLFGIMQDKNGKGMIDILGKYFNRAKIFLFPPPSKRSMNPEKLKEDAKKILSLQGIYSSPEDAFVKARNNIDKSRDMIVCLGSLYSIAPLKNLIKQLK